MHTLIIANGTLTLPSQTPFRAEHYDLIIAADGGGRHCVTLGIEPHVLIGDFDSLSEAEISHFKNKNTALIRYPTQKDASDLELAMRYALDKGAHNISVLGALGNRSDHTFSNIFLAARFLSDNCTITFFHGNEEITLLPSGTHTLDGTPGTLVSLIPAGIVRGITTKGLAYPLSDEDLPLGTSRGVSNVMTDDSARVSITSGILLCVIRRPTDAG